MCFPLWFFHFLEDCQTMYYVQVFKNVSSMGNEVVWLQQLFKYFEISTDTTMVGDDKFVTHLTSNPSHHERSKHRYWMSLRLWTCSKTTIDSVSCQNWALNIWLFTRPFLLLSLMLSLVSWKSSIFILQLKGNIIIKYN